MQILRLRCASLRMIIFDPLCAMSFEIAAERVLTSSLVQLVGILRCAQNDSVAAGGAR